MVHLESALGKIENLTVYPGHLPTWLVGYISNFQVLKDLKSPLPCPNQTLFPGRTKYQLYTYHIQSVQNSALHDISSIRLRKYIIAKSYSKFSPCVLTNLYFLNPAISISVYILKIVALEYVRCSLCDLQIMQFVHMDFLILCNNSEVSLPSKDTYTNTYLFTSQPQ